MSAVESSRYGVIRVGFAALPFFVVDASAGYGIEVDRFRSRCAAEYAARLLNAGGAVIDSHAVLGCKVVER